MLLGFYSIKLLFEWQKYQINNLKFLKKNPQAFSYFFPIMTSLLNSLQMELFNYVYTNYLAVLFTKWENHEKSTLYDNSLILKEVTYKTVNGFSSIFYLAFIKSREQCQDNDCFYEIGIQVYMHFFVFLLVRVLLYFTRMAFYIYNKRSIQTKLKNAEFKAHTIYKLKALEDVEFLLVTYNDLLIFFGKIMFFSVAAPLSPLFGFLIIYIYV